MIAVLRMGHRVPRDNRMTTHVALVARAFGADTIFVDTKDKALEKTIRSVCTRFGGNFSIKTGVHPKTVLSQWPGVIVHLTMYGTALSDALNTIPLDTDILIVVGAEKVPAFLYELADVNVAIGNQPHSEVAALAVFLDRITNGMWQKKKFSGRVEIIPCKKGKQVVSHEKEG